MAKKPIQPSVPPSASAATAAGSGIDALLMAALERNDDSLQTGRYLVTFKDNALDEGVQALKAQSLRMADARDFADQALAMEDVGDADAVVFAEIGVALIGGEAARSRSMGAMAEVASDSAIEVIEPEYFVFSDGAVDDYLRGFVRAA